MEKKHREKIRNTGKTQGILSQLECGHPDLDNMCDHIFEVSYDKTTLFADDTIFRFLRGEYCGWLSVEKGA